MRIENLQNENRKYAKSIGNFQGAVQGTNQVTFNLSNT